MSISEHVKKIIKNRESVFRLKLLIIAVFVILFLIKTYLYREDKVVDLLKEETSPTGHLNETHPVSVFFKAKKNRKICMQFIPITWNCVFDRNSKLKITLSDTGGRVVSEKTLECSKLEDHKLSSFVFLDDEELKAGSEYSITFSSNISSEDETLALLRTREQAEDFYTVENGVVTEENVEIAIYE